MAVGSSALCRMAWCPSKWWGGRLVFTVGSYTHAIRTPLQWRCRNLVSLGPLCTAPTAFVATRINACSFRGYLRAPCCCCSVGEHTSTPKAQLLGCGFPGSLLPSGVPLSRAECHNVCQPLGRQKAVAGVMVVPASAYHLPSVFDVLSVWCIQ